MFKWLFKEKGCAKHMNNKLEVIGIDHGWSMMKTISQERFERLIEGMKQAQGITEQLKAENALEWTGCLNNIRACAREIVEKEIIFA